MATPTRPAAGASAGANATPGSRRLPASGASRPGAAGGRTSPTAKVPVLPTAAVPAPAASAAGAAGDDTLATPSTLSPVNPSAKPAARPAARPSARLAASPARPPSATNTRAKGPGTTRLAKPVTARHQRTSGGFARYVVFGIVGLIVIAGLSYSPIMRSMALSKLDAATGEDAILAADAYMKLVGNNPSDLLLLVSGNHGPVEAQVHVAKEAKLFSSLVQISERPLSDPPPGPDGKALTHVNMPGLKTVTQDQRILALDAATAVYDPDSMKRDLPPDELASWAKDGRLKIELSLAAIQLMAKMQPKYGNETLLGIATAQGQDPQRIEAAIDAIGANADAEDIGFAITLLGSRVSDMAVSRTKLTDKITKFASPNQLTSLVGLLNSPKDEVRAIAIEAMGGPHMMLGDSPADYRKREELGKSILPKLDEKTPPVELVATLKAVKGLRLIGARDAVLALVPKLKSLHLEGISDAFMSDLLGKALITTLVPGDAPAAKVPAKDGKDAKPAAVGANDPQQIATEARTQSEDLIAKLITALDDDASRPIAATALSLIGDPSYLGLRAALDKLQAHGDSPECFTALLTLVDKTYNRSDVTKANGKDLGKWKDFLAMDKPRFERIREIMAWMATHRNNLQIGDGRHRADLGEAKEFIAKAQEELDGWLADKSFVPPLGLTKTQVSSIDKDLKMKGKDVRAAFAGSTE
jgi:hypothetical protein